MRDQGAGNRFAAGAPNAGVVTIAGARVSVRGLLGIEASETFEAEGEGGPREATTIAAQTGRSGRAHAPAEALVL